MTAGVKAIIGIVLALVLVSLTYQHFANRGVPPAVRDSIAVLAASRRPDSVAHAAVVVKAETAFVQSEALSARVRAAEARAAQSEADARNLAQRAAQAQSARDSATLYRQAYEVESTTSARLRVALADEQAASAAARESALLSKQADSASQDRLARVERLNTTLVAELEHASGGCKLLPFVRCPTRKESVIIGAALTYVTLRQTHALK